MSGGEGGKDSTIDVAKSHRRLRQFIDQKIDILPFLRGTFARTASAQHGRNTLSDFIYTASCDFMLPNANHRPTFPAQCRCFATIAPAIVIDFLIPPRPVYSRCVKMFQAPMPEATIDKDAEPRSRKDKICFALQ